MRFPAALAFCALPPLLGAGVLAACGGPAFTSAPADASTTQSPDAEAGAGGSFCLLEAGTHTFCDDFDGLPLTTKWDSLDQSGGGSVATDSTTSYSPPGALKSVAPPIVGQSRGRLVKALGTASRVVVAFELLLDSTPMKLAAGAVGGDSFVGINVGPSYTIGLAAHTDHVSYFEDSLGDGGTTVLSSDDLVATSTLQGWTPFVVAIDLAHATLSVAVAGQPLKAGIKITPPSGQTISAVLGAFSHNQTQPLALHFDNVTIDITP